MILLKLMKMNLEKIMRFDFKVSCFAKAEVNESKLHDLILSAIIDSELTDACHVEFVDGFQDKEINESLGDDSDQYF